MTNELKKFIEDLDWCRLNTHMLVDKLEEFIMDNPEGERLFIIDKLIQKFIMRKEGPVTKHPTQGNLQEGVNSDIAIKCLNDWKGKLDRSGKYIGSQQQDYQFRNVKEIDLLSGGKVYSLPFDSKPIPDGYRYEGVFFPFQEKYKDDSEYIKKWEKDYRDYLHTIPAEYVPILLKKGIEYGRLLLKFHRENECFKPQLARSWERRIKIAENIQQEHMAAVPEADSRNLETDNDTAEQDSTFNQLIERVQEKLPGAADYKNFNSLSSYKDRIEYLERQNVNLSATYSHPDLELKIDVTPHTEKEKAILNNALLRQFEKFSPQFSYKQMERNFGKTDPLFYEEIAKKELHLIDTKEFALDWLKPFSPAWIKPLTISGIHSAFEGYKKGKQKEFYKGYNDLIGYEIYRYAGHLKMVLSGAKITLPIVQTERHKTQKYRTFEGLVKAFAGFGIISLPSKMDPAVYHEYANKISLLNYQFNEWLKETRGAEDTDEHGILNYETYLTEEVLMEFIAFIDSEKEQQQEEAVKKHEVKKAELNKMYLKHRGIEPEPIAKQPKRVEEIIAKKVKGSYQSLDQAFISKEYFDKAVSALRQLQVIDDENTNLIGSLCKGVMQVWYSILTEDKIKGRKLKAITDAEFTVLVNRYFKDLEISEKSEGRHFRNTINKTASNKYRTDLLNLM